MALDTFVVLTNQYSSESDALADYEAVRKPTPTSGSSILMTRQCSPARRREKLRSSSERRSRPVRAR